MHFFYKLPPTWPPGLGPQSQTVRRLMSWQTRHGAADSWAGYLVRWGTSWSQHHCSLANYRGGKMDITVIYNFTTRFIALLNVSILNNIYLFCALRFDIYKYLKWCWNLKHATHYQTLSNKFRNNWWCWAFGKWKCDEDNTKNTWYDLLYQVHIHMQGGQDGNVVVVSLTRII